MDQFSTWATIEDHCDLHPVLCALWDQAKRKFWYRGHPLANDLLFAVYEMSRCASFARDGMPCVE